MSHALLLVGDTYSNQNLYYKTRFLVGDPVLYVEIAAGAALVGSGRRTKSADEIEAIALSQSAAERSINRALQLLRASEEFSGILHVDGIPLTSERMRTEIEIALLRDGMDSSHSP